MLVRFLLAFGLLGCLPTLLNAATLTIGGNRPATLITPKGSDTSYPLLVALHGYTGTSAFIDRWLGLSRQVDRLGFALLLPNGTRNSQGYPFWNATPECCDFERTGVDDSGYLAGLIREAQKVAPIDLDRVYIIGHSNGGFMAYRMACEHASLVKGVISIAGAFYRDARLCKTPDDDLKVLQIHGTADETIPYEPNDYVPGARETTQFWVNTLGCQNTSTEKAALDILAGRVIPGRSPSPGNQGDTDVQLWTSCRNSSEVALWTIPGASHLPSFQSQLIDAVFQFLD